LLEALPAGSLDRVSILFPDPWPKRRHAKRRLVQPQLLDRLADLMAGGAELRLATDHPDYLGWILERITVHTAFDWLALRPGDWRERPADWPATRYEQKALEEGRQPSFLRFRRRLTGAT
jgi:tRNA (guanine-N7-)-methyltransferase